MANAAPPPPLLHLSFLEELPSTTPAEAVVSALWLLGVKQRMHPGRHGEYANPPLQFGENVKEQQMAVMIRWLWHCCLEDALASGLLCHPAVVSLSLSLSLLSPLLSLFFFSCSLFKQKFRKNGEILGERCELRSFPPCWEFSGKLLLLWQGKIWRQTGSKPLDLQHPGGFEPTRSAHKGS